FTLTVGNQGRFDLVFLVWALSTLLVLVNLCNLRNLRMLFRSDRTTDFLFRCLARFQDREASIDVIMRLWNHVSSNHLTDFSAGGGSSINCGTHRRDI